MYVMYLKHNIENSGILAGMWPCGTITLITELFTSEGKGQVYGNIHGLLQNHPENTAQLSKPCVCHDDEYYIIAIFVFVV